MTVALTAKNNQVRKIDLIIAQKSSRNVGKGNDYAEKLQAVL